jgi:hypothetical protein
MTTKTVADKLLIRPGSTVWLSDPARQRLVEPLPAGVRVVDRMDAAATAVVFAADAASLRAILEAERDRLASPAALWVAYPKGNRTDINRDSTWPILASVGMRPISQVSLDEVWSGLRFRPLKPGEAPFSGGG